MYLMEDINGGAYSPYNLLDRIWQREWRIIGQDGHNQPQQSAHLETPSLLIWTPSDQGSCHDYFPTIHRGKGHRPPR